MLSACAVQPAATPLPTTENLPFVITPEENPYAPRPEDSGTQRSEVILTSIDLSERSDLTPVRNEFHVLGSMPSTCNELRIKVNPPNQDYQIFIEIYSISDPVLKCDNVFQQFNITVLLGVYSAGRFTIWVNDGYIGDFISL